MSYLKQGSVMQRRAFAALVLLMVIGLAAIGLANDNRANISSGAQQMQSFPGNQAVPLSNADETAVAEHNEDVIQLPGGGLAVRDLKHDVSPPLRDIPPIRPVYQHRPLEREHGLPAVSAPKTDKDSVLQSILGPFVIPSPIANFEGIYNYWGVIPPDTIGDVGPNHYVQQVNVGFEIYAKSNGASLYGPADFNTIFRGFGGPCETQNNGDPVVLYDQLADRWLLSQFAFTSTQSNTFECIAISATGDPLGSYYRYAFTNGLLIFEDYPHIGVWPDGYYMSTNEFAGGAVFSGAGFFAFEREKMLMGQQADMIYFNRPPPQGGFLPSDLDGFTLPPASSPNFFLGPNRQTANSMNQYNFDVVSWDPPAATLVGPLQVAVATWDEDLCPAAREQCIPQPAPGTTLEAIADRVMHRLAYRNFGTHESLVVNHTVDSNAPAGRAGVRWYEFRTPNATTGATTFQQGTFAPADGVHRWMGSIAMDSQGNMALGYSASSTTLFPSIRYTGRLVSDPPGTMPQGEGSIIEGGGSQTETLAGRWGDYSSMNVDVDDCTFWYTQEYYSDTGLRNWRTRIGSFKFPGCVAVTPTVVPTATGPVPTATQTATATMTPCPQGVTTVGSITQADPTMTGRLARNGVVSTCAAPKVCPGVGDSVVRHYDSYTLSNSSGSTQCVTVSIDNNCGNNALLSAAYLGSFNPNNVCENYLADMGASGPTFTYSFNVPPGATYVVTVLENSANVGCASYNISINPSPCAGGTPIATSTNTATRTATATSTATPCVVTPLLTEGFETGTLNSFTATTTLGTSPWTVVTGTVNSGIYSAHVEDPNETSDQQLTQVNTLAIPASAPEARLQFFHTYSFETPDWDGGVLEYSTNGITWVDAGSLITEGGYTGVITATAGNPLSGRPAWVGVKPSYPSFSRVTANLNSLRGQSVKFRFREGSDLNTGAPGWWVDDIRIEVVQQSCATTTAIATGTSTSTAIATGTRTQTANPSSTTTGTIVPPTVTTTGTTVPPTMTRTTIATVVPPTVSLTAVPPTGTRTATGTIIPPTITLTATRTSVPPTVTIVPPTSTALVPTLTPMLPTATGVVPTGTAMPTETAVVPTNTAIAPTQTPGGPTATIVPSATAMPTSTPCTISFSDVPTTHTFYVFIRCLACRGIISGYADGTFRPENNITRGQIAKMVSNAAGFNEPATGQFFEDVPSSNTFYVWIQRLASRNIMSGYPCGGTGEPCGPGSRPYFRWNLDATRGQLSKIVANAAGYNEPVTGQFYADVPPSNPFYNEIMRLTNRNVMSGYPCGGAGEPCDSQNRPYFRWGFNVTRGQASKIVANTFFPGCMTP